MFAIEINHNGPIHLKESNAPSAQPKLNVQPPKQPLEIRHHEKEEWYVVADGIVFTRR